MLIWWFKESTSDFRSFISPFLFIRCTKEWKKNLFRMISLPDHCKWICDVDDANAFLLFLLSVVNDENWECDKRFWGSQWKGIPSTYLKLFLVFFFYSAIQFILSHSYMKCHILHNEMAKKTVIKLNDESISSENHVRDEQSHLVVFWYTNKWEKELLS